MNRRRTYLFIFLGILVTLATGYIFTSLSPQKIIFSFKIPANSRVAFLWEDDGSGEARRIGLNAHPGDQIRVAIEKGDPAILALNDLPKDFFFEVPDEKLEAKNFDGTRWPNLRLIEFENRPLYRSRFRFFWENFDHPILSELRRREKLDAVIAGAESEFSRFIRLLKWTHKQFKEGQPDPYPPWNALTILDWIRSGKTNGFCAQYAQVMVQSLLSFGYQARYVSLTNHEVLEVWSNDYCKWVTMDPTDGIYYTDGKTPLNSYELYLALRENRTNEVQTIGAPANTSRIKSYAIFSVSTRNDHLSQGRSASEFLRDMWKERIHLITPYTNNLPYHEGKIRPVTSFVSDIYFPINTAHVKVLKPVNDDAIEIWLDTVTPGFAGFLASVNGESFKKIKSRYIWKLKQGENRLRLAALNRRRVLGPYTQIVVQRSSMAASK